MSLQPESAALARIGVKPEIAADYSVLLLPENLFESESSETLFEAQDTTFLYKLLREAGVACGAAKDFGMLLPTLDRHSGDRWLGVIWIRDKLVIPILVGAISGFIVSRLTAGPASESTCHAEIVIEAGDNVTHVKYKGPAADLAGILSALHERKTDHDEP